MLGHIVCCLLVLCFAWFKHDVSCYKTTKPGAENIRTEPETEPLSDSTPAMDKGKMGRLLVVFALLPSEDQSVCFTIIHASHFPVKPCWISQFIIWTPVTAAWAAGPFRWLHLLNTWRETCLLSDSHLSVSCVPAFHPVAGRLLSASHRQPAPLLSCCEQSPTPAPVGPETLHWLCKFARLWYSQYEWTWPTYC